MMLHAGCIRLNGVECDTRELLGDEDAPNAIITGLRIPDALHHFAHSKMKLAIV